MRRKIYVWYSDLRELEARGREADSDAERNRVLEGLSELQKEVGELDVPLSYTEEVYHLRSHIAFVRDLVKGLYAREAGEHPADTV